MYIAAHNRRSLQTSFVRRFTAGNGIPGENSLIFRIPVKVKPFYSSILMELEAVIKGCKVS